MSVLISILEYRLDCLAFAGLSLFALLLCRSAIHHRRPGRQLAPGTWWILVFAILVGSALAEWAGHAHPSDRMRLASYEARAGLLSMAGRDALWREAESAGSVMVAKEAARRRAALEEATRAPAM